MFWFNSSIGLLKTCGSVLRILIGNGKCVVGAWLVHSEENKVDLGKELLYGARWQIIVVIWRF